MRKKVRLPNSGNGQHLRLPVSRADADIIILRFRVALEAVRRGDGDRACMQALIHVFLMVAFLKEAGCATVQQSLIDETRLALFAYLKQQTSDDVTRMPLQLVRQLTAIVNEYDFQLHETRFEILLKASQQLARAYREKKDREAMSSSVDRANALHVEALAA